MRRLRSTEYSVPVQDCRDKRVRGVTMVEDQTGYVQLSGDDVLVGGLGRSRESRVMMKGAARWHWQADRAALRVMHANYRRRCQTRYAVVPALGSTMGHLIHHLIGGCGPESGSSVWFARYPYLRLALSFLPTVPTRFCRFGSWALPASQLPSLNTVNSETADEQLRTCVPAPRPTLSNLRIISLLIISRLPLPVRIIISTSLFKLCLRCYILSLNNRALTRLSLDFVCVSLLYSYLLYG
ncbi:hypothetical protein GGR56DRAFT_583748 [Xylariaceae sp. FL0804]|nr:hypothetical protein GGR56DRAFT_583748 [Xylariaceae sp. FL0804]